MKQGINIDKHRCEGISRITFYSLLYSETVSNNEGESVDGTSLLSDVDIRSLYTPLQLLKRKRKSEEVDTMIIDTLNRIKERKNEPEKKDDDYHFCMQVQASLKRLETRKRAMAKLYIHQ